MAENSQLSGNMKNSSTGTSSTDASSEAIGKHKNEIVPHKISNHDKLVQTMVMVDGEWINVNDTNDQANMKDDMNKVNKKVVEAQKGIVEAKSAADSAAKAADSAVNASVVNSDAITAQSAAISEAKSAISSATAAIQQTAANAASDAAKIRADVAQVQSEIDANKAANSASVEALKSDVSAAKQDLADVHDRLDQAQSAIEQNQKLINDSVAKITSDVSATKQELATVHDSLTKAQAAAEQNQKAINDSIAQINANVDATNQDLAGVRKDLTKAQSDITANQKAIDDNVAQISDDITQDRKDIADVRQGLTKAQSDITANQKAVNDNVAQINADITQDRKDITSAQQANADTAKQLDTYSKQATEQGKTIKSIQDKQDGFTATIADVQGNVTQVSDKVDGLSASLKDAQDNVASVKAQADQLSATLTDHAKSIATLTASAKELSSTLKDAQGNISTLQQKADSVSTQLATAQGDIATLQTGVDSVKATLTSHDKSIHTLQADSKSLKDSMADAQGDISTLRKTATDVTSELEDHTGRLSKVEQTASKQATTLSDLQGNLSQVEQKADSNTATISSINKNAMQDRGVITDAKTSFDSLTQLGTYSIKASGLSKMPEQHYGTLVVSGSAGSGWLSQQFVADTTGNVYTRVFSNNAWSAWKQGGSQDAINQVKQTADSNSATIRNVQGDVSTLKQTATGVEAALADHEGDIHTLQADNKSLKDSMADAQGDISTLSKTATSLDSEMKDHAGRLSKVEQSATTQATTLSDLQGNLSQVKQQADGLVTTLKDAQGSITQIQQKADGTLTQLKSAQGDIASLQTDVTGIKATLTSHEGDIHTLQADSKALKDDMADAQGNISNLQKSSTKLDSEFSSQDGRLSKVEQTAKEHTTTISDLGDKLSNMKIGGRNLLTNTDKDISITSHTTDGYPAWANIDTGFSFEHGKTYTFSAEAKNSTSKIAEASIRVFEYSTNTQVGIYAFPADGNRHSVTFAIPNDSHDYHLLLYAGHASIIPGVDVTTTYHHPKLELGNMATDWTPAPEDMATVTQVKQTADGIETTLKSAQGDIDQIKQTAKGTSEQLADVQGNVTNIQKDIDGLKQTTADNAGNIHTLQSDSKSLHDSMQDAQGDISTLKKTSTDVTSELKDHAGRISKTEQTASTLVNEFADQQGHLNRVEQTAQGTQQTVANQQGQINTIKTDAAGMHQTITGQGNQIANINVTLSGLNSKYEGVSGDLGKLKDQTNWKIVTGVLDANQYTKTARIFYQGFQGKNTPNTGWFYLIVDAPTTNRITQTLIKDNSTDTWTRVYNGSWQAWTKGATNLDVTALSNRITTNSTQITQNKQAIALKADQSTVNNLSGEVSQAQAQLKVQADQISSKVSSTDFQTLNGSAMQNRGTVDSPDFNSLTQAGFYTITNPFGGKNYPTGNWGTLEVSGQVTDANGRLNQKYVSDNGGITYTRQYNAGAKSWTSWAKVANQNDIDTLNGEITKNITAIQKNATAIDQTNQRISLKADQTEVDQIKNTASQNSSRLDVMAGQISSKVTATDVNNIVDSKGYATTSTVQSLITQKAGTINESITSLDSKYNTTVTQVQSLTASIDGLQSTVANKADESQITQLSNVIQSKVSTSDFNNLRKAVDLQTLDSADINNMKTNGHYFVRNLANNPVGGWVYVDVTGNGADRIRQDVYQDSGNQHKYRRWFGDSWTAWSQGATESEITQLRDDINLRVKSGDLLSQINIQAGHTLIQSNKIYFDADSFVMSANSKAFIPAAFITNLTADQITTGTLKSIQIDNGDGKFTVNPNGDVVANSIKLRNGQFLQGTIAGSTIYALDNDGAQDPKLAPKSDWYKLTPNMIRWFNHYDQSVGQIGVGQGMLTEGTSKFNGTPGLTISDSAKILLGTAQRIVVNGDEIGNLETTGLDWMSKTNLEIKADGLQVNLDPDRGNGYDGKGAKFSIQKNNKVGFYAGVGDNGNEIQISSGRIGLRGSYFNDGLNDTNTHTFGNIQVNNLHVMNWLGVDKNKNAIVKTSQGSVAINAYETAEYYFGDVGEGQTNNDGIAYIGIEKLFNETVNTTIPYHVFITAYGPGNIWVDQREYNRFVVKSDQPNLKFSWEIKAKRKGYEHTRLQNVDNKLNHMEATS